MKALDFFERHIENNVSLPRAQAGEDTALVAASEQPHTGFHRSRKRRRVVRGYGRGLKRGRGRSESTGELPPVRHRRSATGRDTSREAPSPLGSSSLAGRTTVKHVPFPSSLSMSMVPPCRSTKVRTM